MTAENIRVALVDDQQLVRAGFRMVIDSQPDMTVVIEASDGAQGLREIARVGCDIVLMDVQMPTMNGIDATRELAQLENSPKVVVLTTFDNDEYVMNAIGAGASGFLLKDVDPEQLLSAIRTVFRGDAVMAPQATQKLLRHVGPLLAGPAPSQGESHSLPTDLTPREIEVLTAMAYGYTNSEIASKLFVSEATVKTHVGRVLAKTQSRDRVQAVILAYQVGLVNPDDILREAT
ncbi:response regulator transcription factor [Hoyosella rhizosphaerae]|uniref:DNA-binding response regulator n=1 Tax=Hoyosella rhizosphaerae TaxID=1755582 RepID=A0A916UBF3_9ACTN|nr:response regulator transcription factor [Hoyosella rhizosphaerae]MBN4926020.1 response regulator transcription factor [Hoyosella rhizosphaerae]GGC66166.1 DNA-binding response regulator [Hoyosella rhizosphaerae]